MNADPEAISAEESERYARQITLARVGESGQRRLKCSRVLMIGVGGLGCPASLYLAAAGIGHLTLVDHDRVALSNLQRQILFRTREIGEGKAQLAGERLRELNPLIDVQTVDARFTARNARALIAGHDLVIDGTDNFSTRYLVNDACVLEHVPLLQGAIFRFDAQLSLFHAALEGETRGPCYRCVFPEAPPLEAVGNCADAGVLGVLPGVVGTLMATEAIKALLAIGEGLAGRLLIYDALRAETRAMHITRDPHCRACGETGFTDLQHHAPRLTPEISPDELAKILSERPSGVRIIDVREPREFAQRALPGTENIPLAQLSNSLGQSGGDFILICQSGIRSARAVEIVLASGAASARSLAGGLERWSKR